MPTVNIYSKNSLQEDLIILSSELKPFIAEKLTCGDIKLTPEEVSVRIINVENGVMIGEIELEIKAHAFKERVKKQDEICNDVRKYIMDKYKSLGDVRVWLILSELGHSW